MYGEEEGPTPNSGEHGAEEQLADYASVSANQDSVSPNDVTPSPERGIDASTYIEGWNYAQGRLERARRRWVTVEVIVVLVAAGFGGLNTLKGQYIRERVTEDLFANVTQPNASVSLCNMGNETADIESEIQAVTARWILLLSVVNALPSLFSTLLLGTLSERYGRRLPIICPCIGFFIQSTICLAVVYLHLPLSVFYLGDFFAALFGSLSLFMAGCFSYVTDVTTEKQRMVRIVLIEILIFLAIGAVQIGLGFMIRFHGFAITLWVPFTAFLLSIVNAGSPCLLIETVTPKRKDEQRGLKHVIGDIVHLYSVKTGNRRVLLGLLIPVGLMMAIVIQGGIAITVLYGQGQPFCWESVTIGFFTAISLVIPGLGTLAGAGLLSCLKLGYLWIIQISIVSGLANVLALAMTFVIQTNTLIFASTFLGVFKLLGLPVIRTFLSTAVEDHEHGALFASLGVLDGLAMFLSPIIMNGIYESTVNVLSTAVFFAMSAILLVPIILTGVLQCKKLEKKREARPLTANDGETDDERQPFLQN